MMEKWITQCLFQKRGKEQMFPVSYNFYLEFAVLYIYGIVEETIFSPSFGFPTNVFKICVNIL